MHNFLREISRAEPFANLFERKDRLLEITRVTEHKSFSHIYSMRGINEGGLKTTPNNLNRKSFKMDHVCM